MQDSTTKEISFSPSWRSFFTYYVMIFLCWFGPQLNPEFSGQLNLSPELGLVLGIILLLAVCYQKWGQTYGISPEGVKKIRRFPAGEEELSWDEVDKIEVQRGLTQNMLSIGNIVFTRRDAARKEMVFYGVVNPNEIRKLIERERP
jgi:hypothetical protein